MAESPWAGWKPKTVESKTAGLKTADSKIVNKDPLHGVTLQMMLTHLVEKHGWEELGRHIKIKCFTTDPSLASSLKFLRRTPWARQKVENLYLRSK